MNANLTPLGRGGAVLDGIIFRPLYRAARILPPETRTIILAGSGLLSSLFLLLGPRAGYAPLVFIVIYLALSCDTDGSHLRRRRLYLVSRVIEPLMPVAAAAGWGLHPAIGLAGAVVLSSFRYASISLLVTIPGEIIAGEKEEVGSVDEAFFVRGRFWGVGEEVFILFLGIGAWSGDLRSVLWAMILSPIILIPQMVSLWREIGERSPGPVLPDPVPPYGELLREAGKRRDGPVSRRLNRPLSLLLSRTLLRTDLTPNAATWIASSFGIAGGLLIATGRFITGGIFVHLHSVLDGIDGELARLRGTSTHLGGFHDRIGDMTGEYAIILGIAFASGWWNWAAAAVIANILAVASGDTLTAMGLLLGDGWRPEKTILARISPWVGRDVVLFVLALLTVTGVPWIFLPLLVLIRLSFVSLTAAVIGTSG